MQSIVDTKGAASPYFAEKRPLRVLCDTGAIRRFGLVLAIALRLERIVLDRMSILVEFDLAFRMRLIEALGVPV